MLPGCLSVGVKLKPHSNAPLYPGTQTRDGPNLSPFLWCPPGVVLGPAPFLPSSKAAPLSPLWRSIPLEGKKQVWQYDVIPILVHLLKDQVEEVQANAAGALMYATVTTAGEVACWPGIQAGGVFLCGHWR